MSKQVELSSYIARLQRRLRLAVSLRGAAIVAVTAVVFTLVLVFWLNRYAFPASTIPRARAGLFAGLIVAAGLALVWPLVRLTRARAVGAAEAAHPELEQRLTTFYERRREENNPFLELLAADTLQRTEASAPPASLAPAWQLGALAGAALACIAGLMWMISAGPGYLGYGAALLWTGPKTNVAPLYSLAVTPGDVAVRRHADQWIAAQIAGLKPDKVQLFAHFGSAAGWEPVAMQALPDAGGTGHYQFLFTGLPEDVEYYVAAGPLMSPHYRVRVVDLPAVKAVAVTYHYPRWTGLKPVSEEHAGDLRAIEGTDAELEIEMDRPLTGGQLTLDGGKVIHLTAAEGNRYKGTVHMDKDGAYHVAALDSGQPVRLSEDYFIATEKARPPEVALDRPGRDYRASPIEEVTVGVKAADTFGLNDMHLHYSVNGGADHDLNLLKAPGAKSAEGSTTVRLEDFKLVPGDLVSLYATARDGHAETRTDMTFIQAEPFEREFSQSQQSPGGGGGGGGGGNGQTEISKREKELIAATWKQANDKAATAKDAAAQGQFLADAQAKLRDQVMALSARMGSRDLSSANEEFSAFEKDMQAAASTMAPSSEKLKGMQWKDALPLEQKTLQSLLRAEATFRQIQVAFGQQSSGGGGAGSAGRDLASLFDLELDTAKNQYETAQTASPAEQHAKDVADTLEKLDALAKRQEELASQRSPQQSFEQRWQQEMLRREADQLQRQMEELAKNQQGQQGQQGGPAGSQQGAQQGNQQGNQQGTAQSGQQGSGQQGSGQQGSESGSPSSLSDGQEQASSRTDSQLGAQGSSGSRQRAAARGTNEPGTSGPDPRVAEALSRLRQAGEAMKRSGGAQGNTQAAQQAAAERLREATRELGGVQQQLSSGKVASLAQEADRLAQQERAQAERIGKLASRPSDFASMDAAGMAARVRERNQLAAERQQLSNDLSALQKGVRDTARQIAPSQPGVAGKLRDALTEMDQSDLDNHVQRTADWLRRGVNPNSNGTEAEIAQGLGKLDQQLRQAGQAAGQGRAGQGGGATERGRTGDEVAALDQVERLRSQLEAMAALRGRDGSLAGGQQTGREGQAGGQAQVNGRAGQGKGSNGDRQALGRASQGDSQQAGQPGQAGQPSQAGQPGQAGQRGGSGRRDGFAGKPGDTDALRNGEVRAGGGGAGGTAWGNVNTGNNRYGQGSQRPVPTDASANPADTERSFQQGLRELNQLRHLVGGDTAASKDVQELTRQMQRLDPSRFPGNPAMVEQMHREVLSTVDRLELQLTRGGSSAAHTGKADAVPAGYEQSVATYYRELSAKH